MRKFFTICAIAAASLSYRLRWCGNYGFKQPQPHTNSRDVV